jgi:hypothetical protein
MLLVRRSEREGGLKISDDKRLIRNKVTYIKTKSHFLSGFY